MYRPPSGKELPLRERLSNALRRRLYPNSNLLSKQLAHAIQISEKTIWNMLSANRDPSAETLGKLVAFFGPDLVGEVFALDCQYFKLSDRKAADAIRKIEEGKRELAAALGTGTDND